MQVISARKGEFETGFERGGQTREHAMLVKTAGVRHLIIVVNKMDDPTVEWEEARYVAMPFLDLRSSVPGLNVEE
jgi:peptide chain release factor subunit 3